MSEPKKETVRIVLPNRNDGTPVPASPRENAMINLPPKPVPLSAPPSPLTRLVETPPASQGIPKPPSVPGIPKPPSAGGMPMPPTAPGIPRPLAAPLLPAATIPPLSPKLAPTSGSDASSRVPSPAPGPIGPIGPIGPAPIPPLAKKETGKVIGIGSQTKVLPQATVQFKRPAVSTSKSSVTSAPIVVSNAVEEKSDSELSPVLGGVALAFSLAALAVQVWTMLDFKAP